MKKWISNGVEYREGDVVRVMRIEKADAENGMGDGVMWPNSWIGAEEVSEDTLSMDAYLGMECVIEHIDEDGVFFEGGKGVSYGFPLSSLEKVVA